MRSGLAMALGIAAVALIAAAPASIELPFSDAMFVDLGAGKPGSDAINNNCLACHSTEMVLNQPHLSRIEWQGEVTKMRNVYKAPIDPADEPAIVEWLVAMQAGRADIRSASKTH